MKAGQKSNAQKAVGPRDPYDQMSNRPVSLRALIFFSPSLPAANLVGISLVLQFCIGLPKVRVSGAAPAVSAAYRSGFHALQPAAPTAVQTHTLFIPAAPHERPHGATPCPPSPTTHSHITAHCMDGSAPLPHLISPACNPHTPFTPTQTHTPLQTPTHTRAPSHPSGRGCGHQWLRPGCVHRQWRAVLRGADRHPAGA